MSSLPPAALLVLEQGVAGIVAEGSEPERRTVLPVVAILGNETASDPSAFKATRNIAFRGDRPMSGNPY